jgi:hypothetical protein
MAMRGAAWVAVLISGLLTGCGLTVPVKSELRSDQPRPPEPGRTGYTEQGAYENNIVSHVVCELATGLLQARQDFAVPWLDNWGTAVTLTITAQDQGGLNAGVSFIDPLQNVVQVFPVGGNVTSPQSRSIAVGATAAATAARTETIQFTYLNSDLLQFAVAHPGCAQDFVKGTQVDGDLKIREFLYDKAMIARLGNASLYDRRSKGFKENSFKRPDRPWSWPVFNTFTEEIIFVAAYGGSFTPSWKLARLSANTSASLLAAQRTYTNDLIITLGPVKPPTETAAAALDSAAQNQHNARVQASAIATSIGR